MIPQDKLLHIGLGILWLINVIINLLIFSMFGLGPACAYGTTTYAILYEINQWIRKEGQPNPWDAFCTALPGWAAWGILILLSNI